MRIVLPERPLDLHNHEQVILEAFSVEDAQRLLPKLRAHPRHDAQSPLVRFVWFDLEIRIPAEEEERRYGVTLGLGSEAFRNQDLPAKLSMNSFLWSGSGTPSALAAPPEVHRRLKEEAQRMVDDLNAMFQEVMSTAFSVRPQQLKLF